MHFYNYKEETRFKMAATANHIDQTQNGDNWISFTDKLKSGEVVANTLPITSAKWL